MPVSSTERRAVAWALLAGAISLGGVLLLAAPIENSALATPYFIAPQITPQLLAQGHDAFAKSCSDCHGEDAHGDEGPDLHHLPISNGRIAATIKHGIKGQMPSFAKKYDDAQIAAIAAYVRSLN